MFFFLQFLLYFQHGWPKHQLVGSLSKKTLTIEQNVKLPDANKKTRQICRQLADQRRIGKTTAAKIIKK